MDRKNNIQSIIPLLKSNDVEFAALFGSYARGEAGRKSDIDLVVRFSRPKGILSVMHYR